MPRKAMLKVVILGDSGVGKTSLMNRYHSEKFSGQYKATIGADFLSKTVTLKDSNREATLQIWDTAGQERFQSLGVAFYRGADVCMLVYDVTDPKSIENLKGWKETFLNQICDSSTSKEALNFPMIIMGNKVDKDDGRRVTLTKANEYCRDTLFKDVTKYYHFEVSAKNAKNVDRAFETAAQLALDHEDMKKAEAEKAAAAVSYNPYGGGNTIGSSNNSNGYGTPQRGPSDPYANEYYNPAAATPTPTIPQAPTPYGTPYGAPSQVYNNNNNQYTPNNYGRQQQQQPPPYGYGGSQPQTPYGGQPQTTPTININYAQPGQQLFDAYGRPVQMPQQQQQQPPCC